ncbi:hypothetical protein THAOC_37830 [Thalassiosira oceanica]|uniref:Uncharacterized protein n=1 Tax=Thalassiosira oceanica TaxID=159749 RepID=K0QYE9_THAOC|nr:hypothetical protein THAOC_37830 [Thalassiosira oceanica]|eukprot:EJK43700.1 hypothetical protein THAOC_37830 [Thalassiosira oceanica]
MLPILRDVALNKRFNIQRRLAWSLCKDDTHNRREAKTFLAGQAASYHRSDVINSSKTSSGRVHWMMLRIGLFDRIGLCHGRHIGPPGEAMEELRSSTLPIIVCCAFVPAEPTGCSDRHEDVGRPREMGQFSPESAGRPHAGPFIPLDPQRHLGGISVGWPPVRVRISRSDNATAGVNSSISLLLMLPTSFDGGSWLRSISQPTSSTKHMCTESEQALWQDCAVGRPLVISPFIDLLNHPLEHPLFPCLPLSLSSILTGGTTGGLGGLGER